MDASVLTPTPAIQDMTRNAASLIFIGVFCRKDDLAARLLIRKVAQEVPPGMAIRFIICSPHPVDRDPLLSSELRRHQDIHLLSCEENMNAGKTFLFFTTIRETFPGYLYYAKADTDSYINLPALATALKQIHTPRFYGGRCNGVEQGVIYMSGSFYILSQELIILIEGCGDVCADLSDKGPEDMQTGLMLASLENDGIGLGDLGPNHSILLDRDSTDLAVNPETVYVHALKEPDKFLQVQAAFSRMPNKSAVHGWYWDGPYSTISINEGRKS